MAQYQESYHGWVQLKIWRDLDDSSSRMKVKWSLNHALLLVVENAVPTSTSTLPSLLWINTNDMESKYSIQTDYFKFTAYSLVPAGPKTHKIVSSDQVLIKITNSGQIQRETLFLKDHTMDRSILMSCKVNGNPFPVDMDKSRSHLVFSPPARSSRYHSMLFCQQQNPFEERILLRGTPVLELGSETLEPILPSRKHLLLKVLVLHGEQELFHYRASSSSLSTKTYLNKADLKKLMDRALAHRRDMGGHQKVLLTHFFRNKPQADFNNIFNNRGGLMEIYRKDANGDQDSAINNGNLFGLFFSPALDMRTLQPPSFSFFGDVRLLVAAPILFCERSRLYFADFYCNKKAHYITLVLTKQGSEADQFCQKRLLELDPQTNPFLTREPASAAPARPATSQWYGDFQHHQPTTHQSLGAYGGFSSSRSAFHHLTTSTHLQGYRSGSAGTCHSTAVSSRPAKVYTTLCNMVHIEVLYTEDVHITALQEQFGETKVSWGWCPTRGRGSSLPNGIPKNPMCRECNLPRDDDASDSDNLSSLLRNLQLRW